VRAQRQEPPLPRGPGMSSYSWDWDFRREYFVCTKDGQELCRVSRVEMVECEEHPAILAGYGSCKQDLTREPAQPRGWQAGVAPSWCETWLGVE